MSQLHSYSGQTVLNRNQSNQIVQWLLYCEWTHIKFCLWFVYGEIIWILLHFDISGLQVPLGRPVCENCATRTGHHTSGRRPVLVPSIGWQRLIDFLTEFSSIGLLSLFQNLFCVILLKFRPLFRLSNWVLHHWPVYQSDTNIGFLLILLLIDFRSVNAMGFTAFHTHIVLWGSAQVIWLHFFLPTLNAFMVSVSYISQENTRHLRLWGKMFI